MGARAAVQLGKWAALRDNWTDVQVRGWGRAQTPDYPKVLLPLRGVDTFTEKQQVVEEAGGFGSGHGVCADRQLAETAHPNEPAVPTPPPSRRPPQVPSGHLTGSGATCQFFRRHQADVTFVYGITRLASPPSPSPPSNIAALVRPAVPMCPAGATEQDATRAPRCSVPSGTILCVPCRVGRTLWMDGLLEVSLRTPHHVPRMNPDTSG